MTTSTTHRPAYQRPELSVHERVDDLLSRMTPAEKIGQMTQLPVYSDPDPIMDSIPLAPYSTVITTLLTTASTTPSTPDSASPC
ncbi:hypothetical protein JCM18909_1190 [Cutibacterium acnes JCM 18909]|nr:hypothetical protein JCM18909_1190 [Cutibacterium acnes JCM 18909]